MSSIEFKPISDFVEICDGLRKPINARTRQKRIHGKNIIDLYPYYGATGQVGLIDDYLLDGEYVLVGEDGAPFLDTFKNKAYMINGKGWVNNHAHILKAIEGRSTNEFICHYLNYFNFSGFVNGTTRLKLTKGNLEKIPVPKFTFSHQVKITEKLNCLFEGIDAGFGEIKILRSKLDIYKQSLLDSAIRGKLIAQNPNDEPVTLLLTKIKNKKEFLIKAGKLKKEKSHPAINPEELPFEVSKGWLWSRLRDIADIKGGLAKDSKKKYLNSKMLPYLRVANVQRGYLDLDEIKYIEVPEDKINGLLLENGDILFNEGGDRDKLGRGWVWEGEISECIHQNHVFRARLYSSEIIPEFVSHYGNTFGKNYFLAGGKQTTNLASISLSVLSMLPIPIPPIAEQHRIMEILKILFSEYDFINRELTSFERKIEILKKSILKKAFEGNLI